MPRKAYQVVKQATAAFMADRAMSKGAAIAFYTTFSLAPILFLVATIAGVFLQEAAARDGLLDAVREVMGAPGAQVAATLLEQTVPSQVGLLGTAVGVVMLLVSATTVFAELQDSLNLIWKAAPSSRWMVWDLVRIRLMGLSLIVVLGFLLLVSLVVSTAITAVTARFQPEADMVATAARILNLVVTYLVITAMFAATYRVLPDRHIGWREVLVGAIASALLFSVGKVFIGLYIGNADVTTTYGAAGALVSVLIWVYFTSQIFLYGAEIAKAYAIQRGKYPEVARAEAEA